MKQLPTHLFARCHEISCFVFFDGVPYQHDLTEAYQSNEKSFSHSHLFRSHTLEDSWINNSIFHFSCKRRQIKVGCHVLIKHNGFTMDKFFLLILLMCVVLEYFVQGSPLNDFSFPNSTSLDEEFSNSTTTQETPTTTLALCKYLEM